MATLTPNALRLLQRRAAPSLALARCRPLSTTAFLPATASTLPKKPDSAIRNPPQPPQREYENLRSGHEAPTFLGTRKRLPEFNLVDRVVLVSGGARGLGLIQAEALLEAGATVYVLDRLETPSADFTTIQQRAADELGAALHYRHIDVTDTTALHETVHAIGASHGRLDGLIAAAGINKEGAALDYSAADFNHILNVNVTGVFSTAQAVASEMVARGNGGSIALIASMSGSVANRGLICAAYNASKAAVVQLARNLASEWGRHGIRVNTISPGYIVTPMTRSDFKGSPEREQFLAGGNMLGRLSSPEEYRGAGVFLVSGASSFMTGSDVIIDGGHHAW
ncbi:hypothetical protein EDC01DRAFT_789714 [Geopyxis carbonaria]|nr:hypothetical protein EDC01DRAFT_789714 [Geopyxis carbonaria]